MPRRESITAATVPGIHAALIADYHAESLVIDPRLQFMDIDAAALASVNRDQPHAVHMRRAAERLIDGELFAVEAARVQRLPGADAVVWLRDWHGGVIVTPDDRVLKAASAAVVLL